ncbi:MAG: glycosyltransferase [Planctomycetota bacterium]
MKPERSSRAATITGRLALWSLSAFLAGSAVVVAAGTLVLLTPAGRPGRIASVLDVAVLFTLGAGWTLFFVLFVLQRLFVPARPSVVRPRGEAKVHVALTALDDEVCIGDAVRDFRRPGVHRVIVVENDSRDGTRAAALEAGADEVVTETTRGYGACCMRALAEAAKGLRDEDIVVLCEGDGTFSGQDVGKLLAYLENSDLVLGTRATQELRQTDTQMDFLINPANQIVAKMIQTRFWGVRLTDVGCTYRAMWVGSYRRLRPSLRVNGNHFSPHMFIEALRARMRVIEIPVSFRKRGGIAKGVGSNKIKAAGVALRMLGLLYRA